MPKTFEQLRKEKEQLRNSGVEQDINLLRQQERELKQARLHRSMLNEEAQKRINALKLFENGVYYGAFKKEDEEKVIAVLLNLFAGRDMVSLEEAKAMFDIQE